MILLIDLGATHIRFGWATPSLSSPFVVVSTPVAGDAIVEVICTQVHKADSQNRGYITGLAIGCPGLVDRLGRVHAALHVRLGGLDLQGILQQRLQRPVYVINDANAQALGCAKAGESLSYIVIGTAIGGAHVDNGRLVVGQNGFAGEIGHIAVGDSTELCTCGQHGCLDTTASGWYLARTLGHKWWTLLPTVETARVINQAGRNVGSAALQLAVLLDPARMIIAGHICGHQEFRHGALALWRQRTWVSTTLEFYVDTWPFAWAGLSKFAEFKTTERGMTNE